MNAINLPAGRLLALAALGWIALAALPTAGEEKPPAPPAKPILAAVDALVEKEAPELEKFYKHLHTNPELSLQEVRTAARLAEELKQLGFEVTAKFGATGVVGVYTNGKGPTILVRTDMDALPVTERTGLPYASKARTRDKNGNEVGVMHACGHDMHMTCAIGVARCLSEN